MTCAKKRVICTIFTDVDEYYVGTNDCNNPQEQCPRLPGEGYAKCKTICQQEGHAEEVALKAAIEAGANLDGATVYIEGIGHYCRSCQEQLFAAGIESLRIVR